jgi:mannose-6-phosphate isomerase-like protein (cupin superfamily)
VDAPGVLVPAPAFPNNQRCVFLTNAQVGSQTGLLVLEGPRIQFTAGTLGSVDVGSATARTQPPSGSTTPVVELTTQDNTSGTNPTATFPEDWSGTDKSLFFSDAAVIHASNLTLTGFTRGLLITSTGNTPITGSVTVSSAERLYWDAKSVIQVVTSTVHSPAFALGGEVEAGALASPDLSASSQPPSMIKGKQAEVTLRPGASLASTPHFEGARELLTVERGAVRVTSDGESVDLHQGDSAHYPADVPHAIKNTSDTDAVLFLVVTYARD